MKKWIFLFASVMLLSGCSLNALPNDECDFLTDANWEGTDTQCVNVISFKEDGGFSNWCYCGSPVGDGDLVETFRYRASDQTIHLLDEENHVLEMGTIRYVDDRYLVIDLWGQCYVYENMDTERPVPRSCALEFVGTEELSKPYLHILSYEDGVLRVSSYDYDGDAAESFDTWTLPAQNEMVCSVVSVNIVNGSESVEILELTEDDYADIGEFYTTGYVEINDKGEVASIVFYGESINEFTDGIQYEGKTYLTLDYPMDLFAYFYCSDQCLEEDIIYPIAHERWDMLYCGGDLFVYEEQIEEAIAYYADDENYDWYLVLDEDEISKSYPLSLTQEELEYLYEMDALDFTLTETWTFDDIKQFADIQKKSKDGTVIAWTTLAHCEDLWYWKSEIMEDDPESDAEYMVKLPDSLNKKIFDIIE